MNDILNNEQLMNYITFKLNRIEKNITKEDLLLINEIILDNNIHHINLNILKYFKAIKEITLRNYDITKEDFYTLISLINLENITFDNCKFDNANIIAGLTIKELSLINCEIKDYNFIYIINTIEKLEIINGIIDITKLNKLTNLNFLVLTNSKILDPNHNIMLNNLEKLYIEYTNINNLSILNNLPKLQYLSIDENQKKENEEIINKFRNKNIEIYEEGIHEIGDNYDEE